LDDRKKRVVAGSTDTYFHPMSSFQYSPKNRSAGAFLHYIVDQRRAKPFALPPISALFATWADRARMRQHLARMDDRLLRDIGLSRLDAKREINKPFWSE